MNSSSKLIKTDKGDFPGGPVVKTPPSNAGGAGLIPGGGIKVLQEDGGLGVGGSVGTSKS